MRRHRFHRLMLLLILLIGSLLLAAPAVAAPPSQEGGIHVVQPGETLAAIAYRYGVSLSSLVSANGLSNPDFIFWGQRLVIPGASSASTAVSGGAIHVVQAGEGLAAIALRYGVSASALAQANGIGNPDLIYVGQRLTVPTAGGSASGGGYSAAPLPAVVHSDGIWIDINLSQQALAVYDGSVPIYQGLVSTGLANTPTPTGSYTINRKVESQRMTGPGYDLPNVPWVMYFTDRGHAIHGTYWHASFGIPMSHGCVNMPSADAQWLYDIAPKGTKVVIHY